MDTAEELSKKIMDLAPVETAPIPIELIKAKGKIRSSINNTLENFKFKAKDDSYLFEFKTPIYIEYVIITLDSLDSMRGVKVDAFDILNGSKVRKSISSDLGNSSVKFSLKVISSGFSISFPSMLFSTKSIKKIVVCGYTADQFMLIEEGVNEILKIKNDFLGEARDVIEDIAKQKADLESHKKEAALELEEVKLDISENREKISELEAKKNELNEDIEDKNEASAKLKAKLDLLSSELDKIQANKIDSENIYSILQKEISDIKSEISLKQRHLEELTGDVNSFAEEFSTFVDQGAQQEKIYIGLSLIPLFITGAVVWNMYQGAVNLSVMYEKMPALDLWSVLVTRLPYVAISTFVIGICLKLCLFLFDKIITLHRRKLDLSSITVLAKDVTLASADGLGFSQDQIFEKRTHLKMKMLRAHLNTLIGDFNYEPNAPLASGDLTADAPSKSEDAANMAKQ